MFIEVMKSKIHRMMVTESDLNYVGSITIDESVMIAAGLVENEKVDVNNVNNGERITTYVKPGKAGSKICCLNGPSARKGMVGDLVVIISYGQIDFAEAPFFKPKIVHP